MNAQAVWPDNQNHLWILDPSNPGDEVTVAPGVKLLIVNLAANKVQKIYRFEDLPREKIELNDIRVDTKRQMEDLKPGSRTKVLFGRILSQLETMDFFTLPVLRSIVIKNIIMEMIRQNILIGCFKVRLP